MLYAALVGNVQVMRYLLDRGRDPAIPDQTGLTPLHNAAEEGALFLTLWFPEVERMTSREYKCRYVYSHCRGSGSYLFEFALCLLCRLQGTARL
jgi:hypothetical protein